MGERRRAFVLLLDKFHEALHAYVNVHTTPAKLSTAMDEIQQSDGKAGAPIDGAASLAYFVSLNLLHEGKIQHALALLNNVDADAKAHRRTLAAP